MHSTAHKCKTMNSQHMLRRRSLGFIFVISSEKCSTTRWKKFRLRSAPSLCQQPLQWFWRHCWRTQSQPLSSCQVNPFQPCATGIYLPNGIAKEQVHGRKTYKVFSLNPFYQFWGKTIETYCINKAWGTNNPAIFSLKVRNHTKNVDDSVLSCTVDLPSVSIM